MKSVPITITAEEMKRQPSDSAQINIRITRADLAQLRAKAQRLGVGHTTLARTILLKWIRAS